jgi:hypothetical protein
MCVKFTFEKEVLNSAALGNLSNNDYISKPNPSPEGVSYAPELDAKS